METKTQCGIVLLLNFHSKTVTVFFVVLLNFSVSILQKAGWRKWATEHPDMYSRRPEAVVPDWYTRKVSDIKDSDTKRRLWTWEKTQKPTEKKAYGIKIEVRT